MWSPQARVLGWWFLLLQVARGVTGDCPCNPKYFGRDSMVCVCNSTYCDSYDPVSFPPVGSYVKYESSQNGNRLNRSEGTFTDRTHTPDIVLFLEPMQHYQKIKGFGGSVTDAASINILSLSPATQKNLMSSYFSVEGIEYNMIRIPMASCDFSVRMYTYDDWPNDYELKNFSLVEEDTKMKSVSASSYHAVEITIGQPSAEKIAAPFIRPEVGDGSTDRWSRSPARCQGARTARSRSLQQVRLRGRGGCRPELEPGALKEGPAAHFPAWQRRALSQGCNQP
ncbi:lysosomal acid glucosylceramidase-like [Sphaerodactylus townsendi]|uniref:lysosomal acid glucosylceramidase-like n=1 Tax=Sphaerodactylus townsendi TaxID=933632 RepID=UPI0020276AE2|nr:lysosomal acid glucosylceramidase-like [Sphaerodactylus townsendi]